MQSLDRRGGKHGHFHPESGVNAQSLRGYAQAQLDGENQRKDKARRGGHHGWGNGNGNGHGNGNGNGNSGGGAGMGGGKALVLYDTAGQWGFLGELYAMASANLCGHFGGADTEPVTAYKSGQIANYSAVIYAGSTYYDFTADPIPAAFYNDALASNVPVIWMNDNIWNFALAVGPAAFEAKYGWDPTTSYFAPGGSVGNVTQVSYKSENLTRTIPAGADGGILHPNILGGTYPAVTTLATATDASTGTAFPWAIRSGNLTYIGEVPFAYVNESDRVIAYEDLLFDALLPAAPTRHRALVRLEDLSAADDPAQVQTVATYLWQNHIPYGFNIIPWYEDPLGYYNSGVAVSTPMTQAPAFVTLIKWLTAHGGTPIDEGLTHQYSNVDNPYTGVSGDDAEFYLAHIDANNNVVWDSPVPEDSTSWAQGRVTQALGMFSAMNLAKPALWVTPHYYASELDYAVFTANYHARYDRPIYFQGQLTGSVTSHTNYIGEFYPYVVKDIYGGEVIPENLGDYEPVALNNHPIRLPADIVNEAQLNLAVRDGFASFFYDPSYGLAPLQQTVQGIQGLGYTFVDPGSL